MVQGLETGKQAPRFSLLATGSGRRVDTRSVIGRKVVLIFHLQGTAPTAREINRSVRAHHPDPEDVLVASVIDLSSPTKGPQKRCPLTRTPPSTSSSFPTGAVSSAASAAPGTRAARRPSLS